ncbi:hypothetical protein N658DRAFT_260554 [Parathielavia hyrcaniae]|uniref:Uncharacterized protein n=1 Tax=Parathielavia hyrcaniae TaxID=113614 RepID=A0AAN6PU13_9PEZI|nr:hypothetical protein N658DRAFT_260554 [Parathielavia hyrcaniae]
MLLDTLWTRAEDVPCKPQYRIALHRTLILTGLGFRPGSLIRFCPVHTTQATARTHRSPTTKTTGEQRGTAVQHGNGNREFNNVGTGTQMNVDSNYFEAKGDQNFGMVPSKELMGRCDESRSQTTERDS